MYLRKSLRDISQSAKKDMEGMNVKPATTHPLATQEIDGMIEMIGQLIEKGYAYEKNGTVYFRTRKFGPYWNCLIKIWMIYDPAEDLFLYGGCEKEDPLDFVLWKPKKEGEPFWKSPWSDGRRMAYQCSVMSKVFAGDQIDIHAGRILYFLIMKMRSALQARRPMEKVTKYWMHNAFLNIDNRKMSKSLGNFRMVREIAEQYDLQVLRFFMLSAHYRSPLNFSAELMAASKNGLERIITAAENLKYLAAARMNDDRCRESTNPGN